VTREEFINYLENNKYKYKLVGSKIEITRVDRIILGNVINLHQIEYLPPNVIFSNSGGVKMLNIKNIPEGVEFNNTGAVFLGRSGGGLKIHPSVKFNNRSSIYLGYRGEYLGFDLSTGYGESDIDIESISREFLFMLMVKQGVFK